MDARVEPAHDDQRCADLAQKKEPPFPAAQSYNREASNRVDRSHSTSRRWTTIVMVEKA